MTQRRFDEDLSRLRGSLMRMGGLTEEMIHLCMKLVIERDTSILDRINAHERRVNELQLEIDETGLQLIALHQPAARDLRVIVAVLKANSDLERIGDLAVNLAETGSYFCNLPSIPLGDIPRMGELASSMLKDSLDAFSREDVDLARSVIRRDDEEDELKSQTFSELIELMQADASKIQRGLHIILMSRSLERMADHATNIAENVIFMTLGKDIRHPAERSTEKEAA